jgi:hypothetical protein
MGRISQKLVDAMCRQTPPTDDELNEGLQQFAADLFNGTPMLEQLLEDGYDVLHIKYILGHQFAMMFSDAMMEHEEFGEYFDIIVDVENHYVADPDETSPVTGSYFSLWSLFDLRFGADQETMGACLTDVLKAMRADPYVLRVMRFLSDSRMSFYQHQGSDGPYVRLRELVTGQELRCHSASGHPGQPGELWFARLGPPLDEGRDYHVTLNTPYVLTKATVDDWTAYLNKSLLGCGAGEPRNLHELLKFGKRRTAWHDFVVRAFQSADDHAVYLAGLPDVPSSLPNARCIETLRERDTRPGTVLAQERVPLALTAVQLKALANLLPELRDMPECKPRKLASVKLMRLQLQRVEERVPGVLSELKGPQRKPYARLLELAVSDRLLATGQAVYQIRVELDYAHPGIWREIQTYDCTLDELHYLIQAAMGWGNEHPYDFVVGGVRYTLSQEELSSCSPDAGDAHFTYLSQVVLLNKRPFSFLYTYDFGDEWRHTITVQEVVPVSKEMRYPVCLDGSRACPPEDCGGIFSYGFLLETLGDPASDNYDETAEWLGEFDPDSFEAKAATRAMRRCMER